MAEKTPTYNSKSTAAGTWVNTTSCTTGSCATTVDIEEASFDLVTTTYGTFTSASTYLGGLGSCTTSVGLTIPEECAYCKANLRGAENNLCRPCRDLLKRALIKRNNQGEYVKWDTKKPVEPLHNSIRPEDTTTFGLDLSTTSDTLAWTTDGGATYN